MHSDIRPVPATVAEALPGTVPTVSPASEGRGLAQSVANLPQVAGKEPCATCGSSTWTEAVFSNHALYCADCAREIRRVQESPPMPPTPSQQRSLLDWIAPHRSVRP
jgi:hypothetical protein